MPNLNLSGLKVVFLDVRFWIVLFFVVRLIGITNPPLEGGHNWRQTDVTMVARNFLEVDNNILYPRLDVGGEKSGITGSEFPLLNYIIYAVSEVFGYEHWYGRLINLVVSSLGLWFFFKLIKRFFSKEIAFYSTLFLLFSIWFTFSRKVMPSSFSISLVMIGFYYGTNYLLSIGKQWVNLTLMLLLIVAGTLSKIPSAYILILFLLFYFDSKISIGKKITISILMVLMIMPTIYWHFVWVPHLVKTFQYYHFFMGYSLIEGTYLIFENLGGVAKHYLETAIKYTGFAVFAFGLYHSIKNRNKLLLLVFFALFVGFLPIVLKSGVNFAVHTYYIIPFVPAMCLIAGYAASVIKNKKIQWLIVLVFITDSIIGHQHDFRLKEKEVAILNLEGDLDSVSSRSDLIMINAQENPTPVYFAHRKGWSVHNEKLLNASFINDAKSKGLKYIVVLKRIFGSNVELDYPELLSNQDYTIYSLTDEK